MLKISTRHNLLYIILAVASYNIRRIVKIFIGSIFKIGGTVFFTFLMFIGECSTGFIVSQYQRIFFLKDKKNVFPDSLIERNRKKLFKKDGNLKIYFLIFMIAFFDFFEFSTSVYYISKFPDISGSLELRLFGIIIIYSTTIHNCILKYKILRHQFFCILIIGVCLLIVIISEVLIKKDDISLSKSNFVLLIFLLLVEMLGISLIHSEEKYLIEFDSLSPSNLLFKEGFFGFIISFLGLINDNPIRKLQIVYDNCSGGFFALFIFLCFIYIVLSGIHNIYKIYVISLYSIMTVSLANYFFNPFFMIHDFISGGDYIIKGEKNTSYFILNLILSIIISICGCIFNDILVINCCGLAYDTYKEISERARYSSNFRLSELMPTSKDDESESKDNSRTYDIYV